MSDSKVFKLIDDVTIEMVANGVECFLHDKKNLHAECVKTTEGYLVQAKQEESWKKFVGMDTAIQVHFIPTGDMVSVQIGSGKWVDKAGAAAAGMIVFAPLAVTAAIGAWNQKKLPEEIFNFIEQFIMSGGKNVSVGSGNVVNSGEVLCPNCNTPNPSNSKFCISCGSKLTLECPNCGKPIPQGVKFCPECGASTVVKHTCPQCGTEISDSQKFCPECGTKIE